MRAQETNSWDDLEASLGFGVGLLFGTFLGSLSDLLGLRLSLPLQSRPAQISEGTQESTEQLELCQLNNATLNTPDEKSLRGAV
jgi:hypothetical protein